MSDPLRMNGPGLPVELLHALIPRPHPVDVQPPSHRIKPPEDAGAQFSSTRQDLTGRGDEQMLSELRMLGEMHRAYKDARAAQGKES
jgi:hypothetical protein